MHGCLRSILVAVFVTAVLPAQNKAPAPLTDWGKWEALSSGQALSGNGQWMAYVIRRSNGNHELRVSALADGKTHTAAFGDSAAFSGDSQWVAYLIGLHEDQEAKLRKDKKPVHKKLGLMKLSSGEVTTFDDIESFAFARMGSFLAMKHYAPEKAPAPQPAPENAPPPEPQGATLTVRDLGVGSSSSFGGVASYLWEDKGSLLAMTISNEGKAGNAVQIFDAMAGLLRSLDSAAATYHGLTWRKDSRDLAVLRTSVNKDYDDETCSILAFRASANKQVYDPASDTAFPAGKRILKSVAPTWSEDGNTLLVGLSDWDKKPAPMTKKEGDELVSVDIWHSTDGRVISEQKVRANRDRQRSTLAAWALGTPSLVAIGRHHDEIIRPLKDYTIVVDGKPYEAEARFGRPYWDVYRADPKTGERTRVLEKIEWFGRGTALSRSGRFFAFVRADQLWLCDVSTGKLTNLTKTLPPAFIETEYDHPVKQRPPFGFAGWTKDDASLLAYDRYDIWEIPVTGVKPRKLTNGSKEEIVYRYTRLDPKEEFINLEKPVYLQITGRWSRKSGYAVLAGGKVEQPVWLPKLVDRLSKAQDADVYAYSVQSFEDSPDFFTAGPDLKEGRQFTSTNAFQSDYAWGHSELIEYKSPAGVRLQGALYYPAGFEPGKKYPMIVSIYEKQSQGIHRYPVLSPRDMYNPGVYTSLGYFVYMPDIVFRPRDPGGSIVECVEAAVKKVLEKSSIDPKHIGLTGHSWGGYGTVFTSTKSKTFAAAIAGAPLTNLSSSYGEIYGNTGTPETDHVETGQERMEVPVYEDPQAFIRNSATFQVKTMNTPLLIAHGDKDGACDLHQSIEMYNVARRAGKQLVLMVYAGENHGLVSKPVRLDYQQRSREWFAHYLKGEPAPAWITSGVSFLEREKEVKRWKDAKPAETKPQS